MLLYLTRLSGGAVGNLSSGFASISSRSCAKERRRHLGLLLRLERCLVQLLELLQHLLLVAGNRSGLLLELLKLKLLISDGLLLGLEGGDLLLQAVMLELRGTKVGLEGGGKLLLVRLILLFLR